MRPTTLFLICLITLFMWVSQLFGQQPGSVSLDNCYQWSHDQYPLLQQKGLNQQALQLRLDQLEIQRLPQIALQGKASLQSEAIKVQFPSPGGEGIELPLFNAQATIEANYNIYDGGLVKANRLVEEQQTAVAQQSIEVELYRLHEQVNQLYFGILLVRAQDSLLDRSMQTLEVRRESLEAGVKHGVVLPSEPDRLSVELLRLEAQRTELRQKERSLLAVLSAITGQELTQATNFSVPQNTVVQWNAPLQRPEQVLFALQKQQLLAQEPLIEARRRPKVNAFVQAGLGYPNPLNFFDINVSPFAIAGLQFRWTLFDWGQAKKEREWLTVRSQIVDNQRATFEYNLRNADGQYKEEAAKLNALIDNDRAIGQLQNSILQQVSAQLDHGVATAADYITQVNAETQARLNLRLHELQLQQLYTDYKNHTGSN